MKHLGDITKINGHDVPLVDIVTGGSPCQDLSVAGKRAGLDGARSGLFMEQIRIIKEMRDEARQLCMRGAIDTIRPRYMVWENVPGAFSSNKGEDFRCVLEETARIADKDAVIPGPKGGRWSPSGCILGDGWSIAWRVHDAQFWGVPQRRKRIALVADFGGDTAPEILFERQGLSGNTEESREKGQGITATSEGNSFETISFQERAGKPGGGKGILIQNERVGALSTLNNQSVLDKCLNPWDVQSKHIQPQDGKAEALYSGECRYGGGESYVLSVNEKMGQTYIGEEIGNTLGARDYKQPQSVVYCLQGNGIDRADTAGCNGKGWREDQSYTLNTIDRPAVMTMQRSDEYKLGGVASTIAQRDYKGATDLVIQSVPCVPETQSI